MRHPFLEMDMQSTFKLLNPDDIQAQVTVTMSLGQWKELRGQIGDAWPGWKFASVISDVINKAEQSFYARAEGEEE